MEGNRRTAIERQLRSFERRVMRVAENIDRGVEVIGPVVESAPKSFAFDTRFTGNTYAARRRSVQEASRLLFFRDKAKEHSIIK